MPSADASTPDPTYGRPASSSMPCTVPSSPCVPCRIGKTTSTRPRERSAPSASRTVSSRPAVPSGQRTRVPLSATRGRASASSASAEASSSWRVKAPSGVMPTGITSNRSRSMAPSTPLAVAQLMECSLEVPPKRSTTRIRAVMVTPPGACRRRWSGAVRCRAGTACPPAPATPAPRSAWARRAGARARARAPRRTAPRPSAACSSRRR